MRVSVVIVMRDLWKQRRAQHYSTARDCSTDLSG